MKIIILPFQKSLQFQAIHSSYNFKKETVGKKYG